MSLNFLFFSVSIADWFNELGLSVKVAVSINEVYLGNNFTNIISYIDSRKLEDSRTDWLIGG